MRKILCSFGVIQAFIDVANSLLPEATREAAALKLQDMRFEVHTTTSLSQPVYLRSEREVRDILLVHRSALP